MENIIYWLQNINLQDIWSFIVDPPNSGVFLYVKVIFLAISLLLLAFIIPLIMVTSWMKYRYVEDAAEFMTFRPYGAKKGLKSWTKIIKRLDSGRESEYKLAIIEADSLLEISLDIEGYTGDLMEEKLEKVDPSVLSHKEGVLQAHKVRNNVVHNPDYELTLEETKKALAIYEEALRALEAF